MPSLAVMEVDDSTHEVIEAAPAMTSGSSENRSTVIDPHTPTLVASKPSQTKNGRSKKKRKVSPSAEKDASNKEKQLKNQPTLASFFGSRAPASSPQSQIGGTKRTLAPTSQSPTPRNTEGSDKTVEKSGGTLDEEDTVKPRNIFSAVGKACTTKASSSVGTTESVGKIEKTTKPLASDADSDKQESEAKLPLATVSNGDKGKPAEDGAEETLPAPQGDANDQLPSGTSASGASADNAIHEKSPTAETTPPKDVVTIDSNTELKLELPTEQKQLLEKSQELIKRYTERAFGLIFEAQGGIEEEEFELPALEALSDDCDTDQAFPDTVVANMALLIEGSSLPLSKLVGQVCEKLDQHHGKKWSPESVDAKIKIIAKRRPMFNSLTSTANTNIFEDEEKDRMWRWEIVTIDVLNSEVVSKVRKARSARRKLSSNHAALVKLIQTLANAEASIRDMKVKSVASLKAKISLDEEKVLKFEREAEKKRLALQAKRKKQEEVEAKRREKERLAEEKRLEKELKKQEAEEKKRREKELKKQEAEKKKLELEQKRQEQAEAREAARRQKEEAKEKLEVEKRREEEQKKERLNKQKKCMMSFFGAPKKSASKPAEDSTQSQPKSAEGESANAQNSAFNVEKFRSQLDSYDSHAAIPVSSKDSSARVSATRKRRTEKVDVSVYVTVIPGESNPFDAQPFAELRTLRVPNKYRFLSFHEDTRPPYHGTWSKKSYIVTGRRPFGKDTSQLDYDYDSEAEWEEGDDEMGEDVEDEAKNQEEEMDEGNDRIYDYDDGFCVADDQYLDTDENADDEDKVLYKRKLEVNKTGEAPIAVLNKIRVIAPNPGGLPYSGGQDSSSKCLEGIEWKEGKELLAKLRGSKLSDPYLCLDAFPPPLNDEGEPKHDTPVPASSPSNGSDEYTKEEMVILARFIHLNKLNSKEKIIEELRKDHLALFGSRAKATRKLDSIATKKRHQSGVYWEVKKEVLEELGLQDLVNKSVEFEDNKVGATPSSDDYTKEEMVIFARVVHLNTLNSKEKIIEELRKDHLASFGSRAKATRKLDAIATKKRRQNAVGVYWEVKKEVLFSLGLHDLLKKSKQLEQEIAATATDKAKVTDGKKTPPPKSKKGKKRLSLDNLAPVKPEKKAKTTDSSADTKGKKVQVAASANLLSNFLIRPKASKKGLSTENAPKKTPVNA